MTVHETLQRNPLAEAPWPACLNLPYSGHSSRWLLLIFFGTLITLWHYLLTYLFTYLGPICSLESSMQSPGEQGPSMFYSALNAPTWAPSWVSRKFAINIWWLLLLTVSIQGLAHSKSSKNFNSHHHHHYHHHYHHCCPPTVLSL